MAKETEMVKIEKLLQLEARLVVGFEAVQGIACLRIHVVRGYWETRMGLET